MAQQFEAIKPGETDAITYYFVTNQENFQKYLTNDFFLGAKYGDTTFHPNIKIVVFPYSKSIKIIKEHCHLFGPPGVRLADFKIFMPDQVSHSGVLHKQEKVPQNPIETHQSQLEKKVQQSQQEIPKKSQDDSTFSFSPGMSHHEEPKFSQTSVTSLINDYEKQREKIANNSVGNIQENDAISESHATIRSILKLFASLEHHESSSKKRKFNETDTETTIMDTAAFKEKFYSLKKLKTSSPNDLDLDLKNLHETLTASQTKVPKFPLETPIFNKSTQ